jgi:uncharacterized membrane protein YphA (DoxX/SURF4 family)
MDAINTLEAAPVSRRRATRVLLWTGQILFAALFIFGGSSKLLGNNPEVVQGFAKLGGDWFRYFVGILELSGGIGLLIPSLSGLAALELVAVMIGATLTHLLFQPPAYFAVLPATIGVLLALVARARTAEITAALASVRR